MKRHSIAGTAAVVLAGTILFGASAHFGSEVCCAASEGEITVILDGKQVGFDQPPVIMNEMLGYEVSWDENTRSAEMTNGVKSITLTQTSDVIIVDDWIYMTDQAPEIVSDRLLVPVRAAAECADFDVQWDEGARRVTISSENPASAAQGGVGRSESVNDVYDWKWLADNPVQYDLDGDGSIDTLSVIDTYTLLNREGASFDWYPNTNTFWLTINGRNYYVCGSRFEVTHVMVADIDPTDNCLDIAVINRPKGAGSAYICRFDGKKLKFLSNDEYYDYLGKNVKGPSFYCVTLPETGYQGAEGEPKITLDNSDVGNISFELSLGGYSHRFHKISEFGYKE